jgi:hypothetical protein
MMLLKPKPGSEAMQDLPLLDKIIANSWLSEYVEWF